MKWVVRPGYPPEQYDALRAAFKDGASLPDTHAEWLRYSEYFERRMRKIGRNVVRVDLDLEEFRTWCRSEGRELDAGARQAFAESRVPAAIVRPRR
jgi:hypothetical protein